MLTMFLASAAVVFSADCTVTTKFGATTWRFPGYSVATANLHRVSVCQSDGTWISFDTCPRGEQLVDRERCWNDCDTDRIWTPLCDRWCSCEPRTPIASTTTKTTTTNANALVVRVGETRDHELGVSNMHAHVYEDERLGHEYEPQALVTTYFQRYPGYNGHQEILGNVVVVTNGYELILVYNFNGLEYGTMGGFHIHEGHHCNDASTIGGHFYDHNKMHSDPWESNKWRSMNNGFGEGVLKINTGYPTLSYNDYHTVVVHTSDGTRAACAELRPLQSRRRLDASLGQAFCDCMTSGSACPGCGPPQASLGHNNEPLALVTTYFQPYPGYKGFQRNIEGNVVVFSTGHSLILVYNFMWLEYGTMGGFHIHEGHHCNDASTIGGHFYDHNKMHSDPWENNKWRSMNNGFGEGVLEIETGYSSLSYNDYHTVVIHTSDGTRAACAELRPLQSRRRMEEPMRRLLANMS